MDVHWLYNTFFLYAKLEIENLCLSKKSISGENNEN